MLWVIFAILTGFAVLSILWPLAKTPRGVSRGASDIAFYKSQLAGIERDAVQGLMTPEDAQGASAEAARRLMALAEPPLERSVAGAGRAVRFASIAVLIFVPALALGLYSVIGDPARPDLPLAARNEASPARMDLMAAVAKIEAHIAQNPDDGRAYEVLAPVYLRMGRGNDAAQAYAAALRLLGQTPERLALYGEALIYAANGAVTEEARKIFEAAAKDPSLAKPRFFLGLAAAQDGDLLRARDIWERLLAEAPDNPPWAQALRERMAAMPGAPAAAQNESAARDAPAVEGGSGAKANLAAKIQAMPEAERSSAIRGMVDALAARLAQNGQDVDGWLRLVRAYAVLREPDKARAALVDAKRNLANDATAIGRIEALGRELGLEG
ncbi:c-type cytochrome biogenesis protein CcmI [Methylocapsa aurea]|uniref:c-type cytochrome biogenesis protein CcmI n=1 Tax=Methylocapsa aurea TaxID=663610 RepID=UPI0005697821|nr:c-type cytochrome biogenesis protein CcmI [Methylocapsa aurea]